MKKKKKKISCKIECGDNQPLPEESSNTCGNIKQPLLFSQVFMPLLPEEEQPPIVPLTLSLLKLDFSTFRKIEIVFRMKSSNIPDEDKSKLQYPKCTTRQLTRAIEFIMMLESSQKFGGIQLVGNNILIPETNVQESNASFRGLPINGDHDIVQQKNNIVQIPSEYMNFNVKNDTIESFEQKMPLVTTTNPCGNIEKNNQSIQGKHLRPPDGTGDAVSVDDRFSTDSDTLRRIVMFKRLQSLGHVKTMKSGYGATLVATTDGSNLSQLLDSNLLDVCKPEANDFSDIQNVQEKCSRTVSATDIVTHFTNSPNITDVNQNPGGFVINDVMYDFVDNNETTKTTVEDICHDDSQIVSLKIPLIKCDKGSLARKLRILKRKRHIRQRRSPRNPTGKQIFCGSVLNDELKIPYMFTATHPLHRNFKSDLLLRKTKGKVYNAETYHLLKRSTRKISSIFHRKTKRKGKLKNHGAVTTEQFSPNHKSENDATCNELLIATLLCLSLWQLIFGTTPRFKIFPTLQCTANHSSSTQDLHPKIAASNYITYTEDYFTLIPPIYGNLPKFK